MSVRVGQKVSAGLMFAFPAIGNCLGDNNVFEKMAITSKCL